MNTSQNCMGKGIFLPINEQTANIQAEIPSTPDRRQTTPLSSQEFIAQHSDLMGLLLPELAQQLNERLKVSPVHYVNVLDCIGFLRAFTPSVSQFDETHYALLVEGALINGFSWIPAQTDRANEEANNIIEYTDETRHLFREILSTNADGVFLSSTRSDTEFLADDSDQNQYKWLTHALELMGVEVLDYLLMYEDYNVSCLYTDRARRGANFPIDEFEFHGLSQEARARFFDADDFYQPTQDDASHD